MIRLPFGASLAPGAPLRTRQFGPIRLRCREWWTTMPDKRTARVSLRIEFGAVGFNTLFAEGEDASGGFYWRDHMWHIVSKTRRRRLYPLVAVLVGWLQRVFDTHY